MNTSKTKIRILNSFTAAILVLAILIIPISTAMAITPDDENRNAPADISEIVQIDSGNSSVTVTKADNTLISPDASGNYNNVPGDSKIKIHYEFSLPNDNGKTAPDYKEYYYLSGDTYTIHLPSGLQYQSITDVPLYTDSTKSVSIGTLKVNSSGIATVTFNDYITKNSDVTGWFDINGTFLPDTVDNGTPITIVFDSKTITINPQIPAAPALALTKKGSYDAASNEITWVITVSPPAGKSVANVSLEDDYSNNQTYVHDSFTLNSASIPDGNLILDSNKITYNFSENISGQQIITYKTTPAADAFGSENTSTASGSFQNIATLKINNVQNGNPVTSKVTLDWISKTAGQYNYSTRTINWTVNVGIANQTITGAIVNDILPEGLALKTDTVKWKASSSSSAVAVDQDTVSPDSPAEEKFSYDTSTRTIKYNAGTLNGQGTLSYTTVVTNPDSDLNLNEAKSYINNASLSWTEGSSSGSPSVAATATVGKGGLIAKSGNNNTSNFDYKNSVIHWKITVNHNAVSLPSGIVISDSINAGQKFLPETFQVLGDSSAAASLDSYNDNSFSCTFSGPVKSTQTITYDTKITDFTSLYSNNNNVSFGNDAKLKNGTETYDAPGQQLFSSQILDKSIAASYNYDTHQITWQMTVNRNSLPMKNARVTDDLPAGMTYLAGSLAVDGVKTTPDSNSTDISVSYTFTGQINEQHIITLTTQMTDDLLKTPFDSKQFTNKASLKSDEMTSPVNITKSCTISNPIITKSSNYTNGADYIDWAVEINKSQIDLGKGITLTDDLVSALKLETDTVKIYPATVNPSSGTLVAGSTSIPSDQYTVLYDTDPIYPNRFTLTFKNIVNSAYVLVFSTDVLPFTGDITNKITLSGMVNGQIPSSTANKIQVDSVNAGGGGANGSISILKTDSVGNPLAGAKFELLNISGAKLDEKTSLDDGKIEFNNLQFRTFYIRETQPPVGYLLSATDQRLRLTSTIKDYTYTVKDEKAEGTVSFQKVSKGGALLSGGSFQLTGIDYAGKSVNLLASSSGGTVAFQNVPLGNNYEIREITPPSGFVKSNTILTASIQYNSDKTGVVSSISQNALENDPAPSGGGNGGGNVISSYSVSITKTDESGKHLAGAEFTLYDAKGTVVAKSVSNTQGLAVFNNLAEGQYTALETKAPDGFEINSKVLPITVNDTTTNSFTVVNKAKNFFPGIIQIKKTDESGSALSGAVFTLYATDGTILSSITTDANGLAVWKGVPQGKYTVFETRVPNGYVSENNGGTAVTVKYGETTALTVQNKKAAVNDGIIQIKKANVNGEALSGAEFTLYDSNGKTLQKLISDPNGLVTFTGLKAEAYSVKETTAPKGYQLFNDPLNITLRDGQKASFTLRDAAVDDDTPAVLGWTDSGNLPKTGGFPVSAALLASGVLLVLIGVCIRRRHHKRYKNV